MTCVIYRFDAASHHDDVWRSAGRIPLPTTAGRVSFHRYASPLRSDRLLRAVEEWSRDETLLTVHEIPRNEVVFKARSAPAQLWMVIEGQARLIFHAKGSKAGYSRLAAQGELLGLTETIAQLPFSTTLTTVSRCVCYSVPKAELLGLLYADAALRADLLSVVAAGLARTKLR